MKFEKFKEKGQKLCNKMERVEKDLKELDKSSLNILEYGVYTYKWNRLSSKKDELHQKLAKLNEKTIEIE